MFKTLHKGQETHLRRRLYDLRVILWEVRSIYQFNIDRRVKIPELKSKAQQPVIRRAEQYPSHVTWGLSFLQVRWISIRLSQVSQRVVQQNETLHKSTSFSFRSYPDKNQVLLHFLCITACIEYIYRALLLTQFSDLMNLDQRRSKNHLLMLIIFYCKKRQNMCL